MRKAKTSEEGLKLYLAAAYTNSMHRTGRIYTSHWGDRERAAFDSVRHILESYHYIKSRLTLQRIRRDGTKIFLDSGAFSAFTKGSHIDLRSYCIYIHENADILEHANVNGHNLPLASVLDAIGSAENTWDNQRRMEDMGIYPLPCFHYGEPEAALEYYIAHYPYVTLGGMVPVSTPQLVLWLDRIWKNYLTYPDGSPRLLVHGFGLTSLQLMERYPWYSVDSSAWIQAAINGGIYLPGHYSALVISPHSSMAKKANMHLETLPAIMRKAVQEKVEAEGFDLHRLQRSHYNRWAFNAHIFTQMMDQLGSQDRRFQQTQPVLF